MTIDPQYQESIIEHLTAIFPGVLIYYSSKEIAEQHLDGKQPEIHLLLDHGQTIGHKDLRAAEIGLAESDIPYTIHLHDLQAIAQQKFNKETREEKQWKA